MCTSIRKDEYSCEKAITTYINIEYSKYVYLELCTSDYSNYTASTVDINMMDSRFHCSKESKHITCKVNQRKEAPSLKMMLDLHTRMTFVFTLSSQPMYV